ncbi:hypothetical protein ACLB1S_11155 [Escherichia coli]
MSLPHLSLADARNLHLAAQGLLNKPTSSVVGGYSGNDLPHVLAANRYHQYFYHSPVIFSRLGNYPAQWLDESLARGELIEDLGT